jgi:hypothetical protein
VEPGTDQELFQADVPRISAGRGTFNRGVYDKGGAGSIIKGPQMDKFEELLYNGDISGLI